VICAVKRSVTCYLKACVYVRVMCIKKLLVCRVNWRDILNYIVISIHSTVVSAINHLLIRVKRIQWFIIVWSVHIYWICVLKLSVSCRCVIMNVQIGCCSTRSVVWNILFIGDDATISCFKPRISEFYIAVFHFWNPFQGVLCYSRSWTLSPTSRLTAEIQWASNECSWKGL